LAGGSPANANDAPLNTIAAAKAIAITILLIFFLSLAVLTDRVDLVGNETVGFPVNRFRILCTVGLDEAEDLSCGLIDPVAEIAHSILALGLEIRLVGTGHIIGRYTPINGVNVHEQRQFAPPLPLDRSQGRRYGSQSVATSGRYP
jgi:hypothetical protein